MSKKFSISKIPATKSEQEQLASLFIQKVLALFFGSGIL